MEKRSTNTDAVSNHEKTPQIEPATDTAAHSNKLVLYDHRPDSFSPRKADITKATKSQAEPKTQLNQPPATMSKTHKYCGQNFLLRKIRAVGRSELFTMQKPSVKSQY